MSLGGFVIITDPGRSLTLKGARLQVEDATSTLSVVHSELWRTYSETLGRLKLRGIYLAPCPSGLASKVQLPCSLCVPSVFSVPRW